MRKSLKLTLVAVFATAALAIWAAAAGATSGAHFFFANSSVNDGRVQQSLTAGPLSAGSFTCPSGQRLVLAKVTYTNIVLTDTTNNVIAHPADVCRSFSTLFPC